MTPGALFLLWIERTCMLLWDQWGLEFSLMDLKALPFTAKLLRDTSLFMTFGVLHSICAQLEIHKYMRKVVPEHFARTFYMVITGFTLMSIMSCWQHIGIQLYPLPYPRRTLIWSQLQCTCLLWLVTFTFSIFLASWMDSALDKFSIKKTRRKSILRVHKSCLPLESMELWDIPFILFSSVLFSWLLAWLWIAYGSLCCALPTCLLECQWRKESWWSCLDSLIWRTQVPAVIPHIPFIKRNKGVKGN